MLVFLIKLLSAEGSPIELGKVWNDLPILPQSRYTHALLVFKSLLQLLNLLLKADSLDFEGLE
jgi:hypothetical protein